MTELATLPMREHADRLLYLDGITVSFDGFKALNNLSFMMRRGELRAIIGPNGAGKTTMMDVITGKTRPDEGTAFYDETYDLTRLDESRIANLGIGRKFQKPTVFENLTVFENMDLARKADRRTARSLFAHLTGRERDQIAETLDMIGLGERWHDLAGALSHGQKQWLEIGMLLVQDAQLLLLDEPVAGMTDHETEATGALIRRLAGERTVVVVEHDMEFVRALDTNVTVLHEGSVLAEGTLAQVQAHPRVIDVYLGR